MPGAALYLRSTKDRSDVSIDAQRRQLMTLAAERGLQVMAEFVDEVQSAKTVDRPGFQRLLVQIGRADRGWDTLLVVDTSRLSREQFVGPVFRLECRRRGVEVIFRSFPDVDPIARVILESVLMAMDTVHSMMSREKGLAGMTENVRQGFRAGGRALWGYRLERIGLGTLREGAEVAKTRLVPGPEAPLVQRYLRRRAAGEPRARVIRDLGIAKAPSTLVHIEWAALAYAGHTVWNRHGRREGSRSVEGTRHRPREEWVIQRDTHPALITDAEAEALMAALKQSPIGRAVSAAKTSISAYLLTGLLHCPAGTRWTGKDGRHYRMPASTGRRGRLLPCAMVDGVVIDRVSRDLASSQFAAQLLRHARSIEPPDELRGLRLELQGLVGKAARAMELSTALEDPAPALRLVDELERRRRELAQSITALEAEHHQATAAQALTERSVAELLARKAATLKDKDRPALKAALAALIAKIILDPATNTCQIHYRITASNEQPDLLRCVSVASPGVRAGCALTATTDHSLGA